MLASRPRAAADACVESLGDMDDVADMLLAGCNVKDEHLKRTN